MVLHREYLNLELYVEQLTEEGEVLSLEKTEKELEDSMLDSAIVRLVANAAVEAVISAKFIVSLIALLRLFLLAKSWSWGSREVHHQQSHLGHIEQGGAG